MTRRLLECYASRGLKTNMKDGVSQLGGLLKADKLDSGTIPSFSEDQK
jgi:hypothetical protein